MSSHQHVQQSSQESNHSTDHPYILDAEDLPTPDTPRAARALDSASETEKESSRKKKDKKKHKGKDKGKDKGDKDRHKDKPHPKDPSPDDMLSTATRPGRRQSSKTKSKTDDWSDVTNPEERRRIQNRIAQRKFREKAREQKERAERELRNQEHAASSYQVPGPYDLGVDDELSGVPWGGPSLRFVVAKGHESISNSGSRRASDYLPDDTAAVAAAAAAVASVTASGYLGVPAAGDPSALGGSVSAATAAAAAAVWADPTDYGMYTFGSSVDGSQAGSSRSSSDFAHTHGLGEDTSYFEDSPYYYD